jgi:hypothetical protein
MPPALASITRLFPAEETVADTIALSYERAQKNCEGGEADGRTDVPPGWTLDARGLGGKTQRASSHTYLILNFCLPPNDLLFFRRPSQHHVVVDFERDTLLLLLLDG